MEWLDDGASYASLNTSDAPDRTPTSEPGVCPLPAPARYPSRLFGTDIAVPEWEAASTAVVLLLVILLTIMGNALVILSVFTYAPLGVQHNFFIVSLAVADLTVAILVMPVYVVFGILGRWVLPGWMCKMWLTCDVMCCTASILNMCAIALDRYRAITDPINYAQRRTLKRVLLTIVMVWVLSFLISSPPLMGWNDWPDEFEADTPCRLTSRPGYVIYSSLGSFYIPLLIMCATYFKILTAAKRRLRERAEASKLDAMQLSVASTCAIGGNQHQAGAESVRLETTLNEDYPAQRKKKRQERGKNETGEGGEVTPAPVTQLQVPTANPPGIETPADSLVANTAGASHQPIEVVCIVRESAKRPRAPDSSAVPVSPQPARRLAQVSRLVEEKQRILLRKERRTVLTLGIIVGVFVVCWLPFFLMYVVLPFCPNCCLSGKVKSFVTWLGYTNSMLNPIIYTIFNIDFRRAFKKLVYQSFPKC